MPRNQALLSEPLPEGGMPDVGGLSPEPRCKIRLDDRVLTDFEDDGLPFWPEILLAIFDSDADAEGGQ